MFHAFVYFYKTLYMFQTVFPSIIRSSKLHIQLQVFVRPILLPAASLARQYRVLTEKHEGNETNWETQV